MVLMVLVGCGCQQYERYSLSYQTDMQTAQCIETALPKVADLKVQHKQRLSKEPMEKSYTLAYQSAPLMMSVFKQKSQWQVVFRWRWQSHQNQNVDIQKMVNSDSDVTHQLVSKLARQCAFRIVSVECEEHHGRKAQNWCSIARKNTKLRHLFKAGATQ